MRDLKLNETTVTSTNAFIVILAVFGRKKTIKKRQKEPLSGLSVKSRYVS